MAQYQHLRIYNKAFDILKDLYERVPKFGKQYKYLLGGKLIESNIKIIELIILANSEKDKEKRQALIEKICLASEILLLNLRVANELRQFGNQRSYLYLSELATDLIRQAEGWKKYNPQNGELEGSSSITGTA